MSALLRTFCWREQQMNLSPLDSIIQLLPLKPVILVTDFIFRQIVGRGVLIPQPKLSRSSILLTFLTELLKPFVALNAQAYHYLNNVANEIVNNEIHSEH
jgi:hypothetical protein